MDDARYVMDDARYVMDDARYVMDDSFIFKAFQSMGRLFLCLSSETFNNIFSICYLGSFVVSYLSILK